jgi:hypothetical protein
MEKDALREFANRDWALIVDLDRVHWATEYRRNGSASAHRAAQALWQHMRSIRPEWPDASDRKRDLDHHIAQKQLLMRISGDHTPCQAAFRS